MGSTTSGWSGGFRDGIGLGVGAFALAVSFGAFAASEGWPLPLVIVMSTVVFSGSAQFALITALSGGKGLVSGLAAAALINARFIPMAAAVASSLRGGRIRRGLEGQAVVDASWVLAQRPEGGFDRAKMIGATLVQWPAWIAGSALGALLVPPPATIRATGLDLVFPCFFLLLLLDTVRADRTHLKVALVAAAISVAAVIRLPAGPALLLSGTAAALVLIRAKGAHS